MFVALNDFKNQKALIFEEAKVELVAYSKLELNKLFEQIARLQQQGLFLVGYLSYEAASLLEEDLHHKPSLELPIAH